MAAQPPPNLKPPAIAWILFERLKARLLAWDAELLEWHVGAMSLLWGLWMVLADPYQHAPQLFAMLARLAPSGTWGATAIGLGTAKLCGVGISLYCLLQTPPCAPPKLTFRLRRGGAMLSVIYWSGLFASLLAGEPGAPSLVFYLGQISASGLLFLWLNASPGWRVIP